MMARRWTVLAVAAGLAACAGSHAEYPLGWPAKLKAADGCAALAGTYRDAGDWRRSDGPGGHAPVAFLALVTTGRPLPLTMQRFTVIADQHTLRMRFSGYAGEREDVSLTDRNGTLVCGPSGAQIHLIWRPVGEAGANTLDLMKAVDGSLAVRSQGTGATYDWYRFWPAQ
jgi:hypothetical protein